MTSISNVSVDVELDRSKLDAEKARMEQELAAIKDVEVNVKINTPNAKVSLGGLDGVYQAANQFYEATNAASGFALGMQVVQGQLRGVASQFDVINGKALDAASAFDAARAAVATLSDEPDKIAQDMRQLSQELNYQASSTDLLKASYDVLSAGFLNAADQAKILKGSALAAKGGFSDVGTVADAVTTVLNAYGKSADEAGKVTDILIATQNAGKVTVDQLANKIGVIATTASNSGVALEELSTLIAIATAKGVKAAGAITGFNQALANTLKPSKEAADYAKQLGIEFGPAALQAGGLAGILQQLRDKGLATSENIVKLFGSVDAMEAIMPVAAASTEEYNKQLAYISNSSGMAAEAADKVSASFEGQMTAAANQANEALISMGKGVMGAVTPLLAAGVKLLELFNALPEPVKGFAGVALATTGGVLTLGVALTGILAILPTLQAGWGVLASLQGASAATTTANTAATAANAAAQTAQAVATGQSAAAEVVDTATTTANTAATTANTAATAANAAAKGGLGAGIAGVAGNLLKLAPIALTAGAGLYTLSELFKRSEGAKFAQQVEDTTKKLREFREEAQKAGQVKPPGQDSPGQGNKPSLEQVFSDKGAIEGTRAALADLDQAIFGTSDRADKFGKQWGIITAEQRGAQLSQFAITDQTMQLGNAMQDTSNLLAKYGLAMGDMGQAKAKLGADGIAKFKTEAAGQIGVIDKNLAALKAQKAPNAEQQQQIDDNIKLLERQKELLRSKIALLEGDTSAIKKNADAQKVANIDQVQNDIKTATGKSDSAQSEYIASLKEQQAAGKVAEETAQKQVADAEQAGMQRRLDILKENLPRLKAAAAGATGDEAVKAQEAIAQAEKQISELRIQIADKTIEEKKKRNQAALDDDRRAAQQQLSTIKNAQTQAATEIRRQQAAGKISKDDAEIKIAQEAQKATQQEIGATESALAQLDARKAAGQISEKEYLDEQARLNTQLHDLKLRQVEQEIAAKEAANRKVLEDDRRAAAQSASNSKIAESQAVARIRSQQLSGSLSKEDAAAAVAKEQSAATGRELANAQAQLATLRQRVAEGRISAKEAAQEEMRLNEQINSAKLQQIEQQIAAKEATEQRAIKAIEKRVEAELFAGQQAADAQTLAIKQNQLTGGVTEQEAQRQIEQVEQARIAKEVATKQRALETLQAARQRGEVSGEESAKREQQLAGELGKLKIQQIDIELEARKRADDLARQALDQKINIEQLRHQQAIANLDAEKTRLIDYGQRADELSKKILESRAALDKAQRALTTQRLETSAKQGTEAIGLRKQLDQGELADNVRQVITKQLGQLGFSAGDSLSALYEEQERRERALAEQKLNALKQEQVLQRQLLEFEIRKEEFAAKAAVIEAKKVLLQQAQVKREGQLEQAKAQAMAPGAERDAAIAAAQSKIEGADLGIGLAQENLGLATEQLAATSEMGRNARAAQFASQSAELGVFVEEANAAGRKRDLERAQADESFTGSARPVFDASAARPISLPPSPSVPVAQGFDALGQKFDKLTSAILDLANKPRSLTVNSQNAVADAGTVYRDIASDRTVGAGL